MVAHRRRQLWKTGSCMNCGGNNHIAKDCFQRPRKIGEHYSREKFEQVGLIQLEDIIINNTKLKFKESRKKKETGGGRIRKDTKKNVLKFDDVCPVYYSRKTRSRLEFKEPNYNFELGDQLSINSWAGLEKGQGVTNPVAPTKLPRIFTESHEAEIPRSNYDEDGYVNNHTAVWGSWWKDHKWGYKCCKQTVRYSFCTAGFVEAAEAATDNMRPSDDLQMA